MIQQHNNNSDWGGGSLCQLGLGELVLRVIEGACDPEVLVRLLPTAAACEVRGIYGR